MADLTPTAGSDEVDPFIARPRLLVVGAGGWFGRTLIHEYLTMFGRGSASQLKLYGSRHSTLQLAGDFSDMHLPVEPLSGIGRENAEAYDGLFWYSFLLPNQISEIGPRAFRRVNDEIAQRVLQVLERNPALRCVFASSGAVFEHKRLPAYDVDPYSYLKLTYERRLRDISEAAVVYPYAVTGMYLPDPQMFALGSFVQQALTSRSIVIDAPGPVVRSYGSVHDLSRYLLTVLGSGQRLPASIVPANFTIDLVQLAVEVCAALDLRPQISTRMSAGVPNAYVVRDFEYVRQLEAVGLHPTAFADQIRLTALGRAFQV